MGKFKNFINQKTLLGEILRFIIVGGFATVIDFLTMAVVLYLIDRQNYSSFWQVFIGGNADPTPFATMLGTGLGFILGVIFNYIFSVIFVFNSNQKVKNAKGFIVFTLLSLGGFLLHELGMWTLFVLLNINEWFVKILMTAIVLVYNFISRRLILFKADKTVIKSDDVKADNQEIDNTKIDKTETDNAETDNT